MDTLLSDDEDDHRIRASRPATGQALAAPAVEGTAEIMRRRNTLRASHTRPARLAELAGTDDQQPEAPALKKSKSMPDLSSSAAGPSRGSRKALAGDEEMVRMLGKEFVEKYILVNEVRFLSLEKLSGAYLP